MVYPAKNVNLDASFVQLRGALISVETELSMAVIVTMETPRTETVVAVSVLWKRIIPAKQPDLTIAATTNPLSWEF